MTNDYDVTEIILFSLRRRRMIKMKQNFELDFLVQNNGRKKKTYSVQVKRIKYI